MPKYFEDNSRSVGGTPLVRLNSVVPSHSKATVLAKIEGRNPSYSVKCRIGVGMIDDALERGILKPGMEILEATSGNTGIALAFVAAAKKIPLTLIMPETMSVERRRVVQLFGANLILTPGSEGMTGAVKKSEQLVAENPGRYYLPKQFENPVNPLTHERTTGPEIWNDTEGTVDVVVAGVGTGGTLSGISRYIKTHSMGTQQELPLHKHQPAGWSQAPDPAGAFHEKNSRSQALTRGKNIVSVAVEPKESPVISQHFANAPQKPGPHKIQGIGAGFLPKTLDLDIIDRVEQVGSDDAIEMARRLAKDEGILCGISSGAAVAAVCQILNGNEFDGKTIVVILPDAGERYLSTALFDV